MRKSIGIYHGKKNPCGKSKVLCFRYHIGKNGILQANPKNSRVIAYEKKHYKKEPWQNKRKNSIFFT